MNYIIKTHLSQNWHSIHRICEQKIQILEGGKRHNLCRQEKLYLLNRSAAIPNSINETNVHFNRKHVLYACTSHIPSLVFLFPDLLI